MVIIDTAGRLQNKIGLMNQLQKMRRVVKKIDPESPHRGLLVMDAKTGQNGWEQARVFQEAVKIDGLVMNKLDGIAKGGLIIGIATTLKIPVCYLGIGEKVTDFEDFDLSLFLKNFFTSA